MHLQNVIAAKLHALLVTPQYYVLLASPWSFDLDQFTRMYCLGQCTWAECFELGAEQPAKAHVFPRSVSNTCEAPGVCAIVC